MVACGSDHTGLPANTKLPAPPRSRVGGKTMGGKSVTPLEEISNEPLKGEDQVIQAVLAGIEAGVRKQKPAFRDAHAKAHGCVRATFEVEEILHKDLAVGLFSRPRKGGYAAWVRYSNGSGDPKSNDTKGDGRGMTVKVMDVAGDKILPDEKDAKTQDFLMINHPQFFVKNAFDYVDFFKNAQAFFASHADEAAVIAAINGKKIPTMLGIQYWSMTPYRLGKLAIKYTAKPAQAVAPAPDLTVDGYLAADLETKLADPKAVFKFDFLVQRRGNPDCFPIENPVKLWPEQASDVAPDCKSNPASGRFSVPEKVATITILGGQ
jgi:hypothetical protein